MEKKVIFDWKSCVALGATAVVVIFAVRMPDDAVEGAFNHMVDAAKSFAVAFKCSH